MAGSLRAGILTIGTEVSSGEIINSNAAWIANELGNLRIDTRWHMTVQDSRQDMHDAMTLMQSRVDILIITGGLGPTADDFTRDVVADWSADRLVFDEASWSHVQERFFSLGVMDPPPSNRQQCYFPERARILTNRKGTANGFAITPHGITVYVLPGPPEEIKAIWQDHIAPQLSTRTAASDPLHLMKWQCIGLSESKLGEQVEAVIKGSSLISGYRPHLPYVEVKIWCLESHLLAEKPRIEELDTTLSKWTVARNEEDCIDPLLEHLDEFDHVVIEDQGTGGALAARFGAKWSSRRTRLSILESFQTERQEHHAVDGHQLYLQISSVNAEGEWDVWYKTAAVQQLRTLKLPFKKNPDREIRERLFVCELSLVAWSRMFQKGTLLA